MNGAAARVGFTGARGWGVVVIATVGSRLATGVGCTSAGDESSTIPSEGTAGFGTTREGGTAEDTGGRSIDVARPSAGTAVGP